MGTADDKRKLAELYRALEPVALFDQIGHLQKLLLEAAADYVPAEPSFETSVAPTDVQQEDCRTTEPTSLKPVPQGKRAYKRTVPHTWRTRKDPLDGAGEYARQLFNENHSITGAELLKRLQEKCPDKFTERQLKTVQRRLSTWRRQHVAEQSAIRPSGSAFDTAACRQVLAQTNPLAPSLVGI